MEPLAPFPPAPLTDPKRRTGRLEPINPGQTDLC